MSQQTGEAEQSGFDGQTVVLVGCGSAKNDGQLPAKDKYSSNYFALKRAYAEAVGDEWSIVSAKYGLLAPDQEIDDYNVTVSDMDVEARADWGRRTGTNIIDWIAQVQQNDLRVTEVHLLLGQDYQEPIKEDLEYLQELGIELVRPFEDTSGIGEQMAKLKELTEAAQEGEA